MKNIIHFIAIPVASAHAGIIECQGVTISENGSKPAKMIMEYDESPSKIRKFSVITDKVRSWKVNQCLLMPETECRKDRPIDLDRQDFAVITSNHSGDPSDGYELGMIVEKKNNQWTGYFRDGSIKSSEVEIDSCRVQKQV